MKILKAGQYYGREKQSEDVSGVRLSEYDYLIPKTDWHYHENPYFMYVMHGDVLDVNKNQTTHCQSGSLVFHNWQEQHFNSKHSESARGFHIEFDRDWFSSRKLDISLWEGSRPILHPEVHTLLGKIYYEFRCQDDYSPISIELLVLQLCEKVSANHFGFQHEPNWVTSLREILNDDPGVLSLKHISDQLGVHPVHISRAIPKYFATSLGDYLRQQKIKKALALLHRPHNSLTEIAHMCGFADQSHFTRTFKAYLNKTPREFKKAF